MDETAYLDELVAKGQIVTIRLTEGRDILAVPVAHDTDAIIVRNKTTGKTSLIYKRSVSVITPEGG